MRIFIAGGAGYVGSPLVYRLLASGHDVTVFDRLNFGAEALVPLLGQKKFKLIQGDVRDVDAVRNHIQGHDAVCLLAAIVGEPACNRDPALAVETNLVGARNVLNASLASGIERFVFVSTCSNYGVVDGNHLVDELAELQPISTYAETKVQFERELLQVEQEHFHPTVLRLSTAFGISPRMRFDLMVSDFALAAVKQRKIVVFGEQFWRPFVHVADIAAAIELSIGAPLSVVTNQVFNIGDSNNNLQKLDLAKLVLKYVEGAELETVTRNTDPRSYRVDFTKAKERLRFSAQWSVEDGVREVVDALKTGVWQSPSDPRYYN